ncbi:MAG TPA: hypothetical protein VED85_08365, partial [Burkholderiaceae bacterium]|nr:hypothetical protein [Burkholderiaceae bacterium]
SVTPTVSYWVLIAATDRARLTSLPVRRKLWGRMRAGFGDIRCNVNFMPTLDGGICGPGGGHCRPLGIA